MSLLEVYLSRLNYSRWQNRKRQLSSELKWEKKSQYSHKSRDGLPRHFLLRSTFTTSVIVRPLIRPVTGSKNLNGDYLLLWPSI